MANKLQKGINDLKTWCEQNGRMDLMLEWDYEKNQGLEPDCVTYASSKKVWWKDKIGHEWQSSITNRTSHNRRCPYCSNQKVLVGFNDLASQNPDLSKEWNYEKNEGLYPTDVTSGTHKNVWWKCEKGHEWLTSVSNRSNGTGCPVCSNQQVLLGYNDLKSTYPEVAAEWNYDKNIDLNPKTIVFGSGKKVWWKCEKGHEWVARICDRTIGASKCPICVNKQLLIGYNDLATIHPNLVAEWNYKKNKNISPECVLFCSSIKVWWTCPKCSYEWQATVAERSCGRGCRRCGSISSHNKISQTKLNQQGSLSDNYPLIVKEWNFEKNAPLFPNEVISGSSLIVWWKCEKGHEWKARILNRTKRNSGCPFCSGQRVLSGFNDLATTNYDLATEWNYDRNQGLTPTEVSAGSGKKVWWKCSQGHEWKVSISNRTTQHLGCPYCSGRKVAIGFNDLATLCPEIVKEWNFDKNAPLFPTDVSVGSGTKVWWKCENGHEWYVSVNSRIKTDENGHHISGCPVCLGLKVLAGFNDLASQNPDLAKEWNYEKNEGLKPTEVTEKSGRKVWWKCSKGHEWQTAIHIRSNGSGCPYCLGKKAISGENDLATVRPDLAKEWNYEKNYPLQPYEFLPNSMKKVWWKCSKGHEWNATIQHRFNFRGCPFCVGKSTSLPEQAIAYYFEKITVVQQRAKLFNKECDIYLPEFNIGIEYDGSYYHENKEEADNEKEKIFIDNGILFFRIIGDAKRNIIKNNHIYCIDDSVGKNFDWALITLLGLIANHTNDVSFSDISVDTIRDIVNIRSRFDLNEKNSSLANKFPNLVKEWNYDKNGSLLPESVLPGSTMRVWWKCSEGHEWQTSISNRTRFNHGCPYCKGRKAIPGKNDLATLRPDVAKEWNYEKNGELQPTEVTVKSSKKVWWKCLKGHEWQTAISNRTANTGCPYCRKESKPKIQCVETGAVFNSLSEATEYCGIKDPSTVSHACKNANKTAGGYHWKYID